MKRNLLGLIGLFAMTSVGALAQQPFSYTVKGELEDASNNGQMIYIKCYDSGKVIDSTKVEGNKFVFTGKADEPAFCRVNVSRQTYGNFILEGGDIQMNLTKNSFPSGTPMNTALAAVMKPEVEASESLGAKSEELRKQYTDDKEFAKNMREYYATVRQGLVDKGADFFKAHTNDAVGEYLIRSPYMPGDDAVAAQKAILDGFGPWLKGRETVKKMLALIESTEKTSEGKMFTEIKGRSAEGKPVSLSDYVGKGNYVLMDMWASWCGPCKREIPNIAMLNEKYKDKGLTVVGVFVWDKEENLKKAMEQEKATWAQIFDSEANATTLYGVKGIPNITLFAPDGTILKRGIRGEEMIRMVDELMTNK